MSGDKYLPRDLEQAAYRPERKARECWTSITPGQIAAIGRSVHKDTVFPN